jgi:hypothetical protein
MKYLIRFNKSRGQAGRGTVDHVWRVLDEQGNEVICKNVKINVPSCGYSPPVPTPAATPDDYSIMAEGVLKIDRETSTVEINSCEC